MRLYRLAQLCNLLVLYNLHKNIAYSTTESFLFCLFYTNIFRKINNIIDTALDAVYDIPNKQKRF